MFYVIIKDQNEYHCTKSVTSIPLHLWKQAVWILVLSEALAQIYQML